MILFGGVGSEYGKSELLNSDLRLPKYANHMHTAVTFFAGFAAATAVIGFILSYREKRSKNSRKDRKARKRSKRFLALSRTLDLAVEMSESCKGQDRAMVAVAVGEDLTLESIEPKLLRFLGYKGKDAHPETIYDLLPPSMASHHRIWVANAIRSKHLPARLQHPLRSVEVRHASGFYVHMDLNIEWAMDCDEPRFELVFAPYARKPDVLSTAKEIAFVDQVEEEFAVVVLLDIVEFTKACSQLSAVEVGGTFHWYRTFGGEQNRLRRPERAGAALDEAGPRRHRGLAARQRPPPHRDPRRQLPRLHHRRRRAGPRRTRAALRHAGVAGRGGPAGHADPDGAGVRARDGGGAGVHGGAGGAVPVRGRGERGGPAGAGGSREISEGGI